MTSPIAEVRDCIVCEGSGLVWTWEPWSVADMHPASCPACAGTGAHVVVLVPGGER